MYILFCIVIIYMSIKNYTEGDIDDITLIVNSNKINTNELNIEGDLKVKSQDGNIINYSTPTIGQAGLQLTIDANGNTFWGTSGGVSGVSNPMSAHLDGNQFNINNVSNVSSTSSISQIVRTNTIRSNTTNDVYIETVNGIVDITGDLKTFIKSNNDIELNSQLGAVISMTGDINEQCNNYILQAQNIDLVSGTSINMNSFIDYKGYFNDYNGGGIYNLNLINLDWNTGSPSYQGLKTNKISSAVGNTIDMSSHSYENIDTLFSTNLHTDNIRSLSTGGIIDCSDDRFNNMKSLTVNEQIICNNVNDLIMVRQESDLPNPIPNGNYLICDIVVLSQSYTFTGDCNFFGFVNGKSELRFNNTLDTNPLNYAMNILNVNVNFYNLKISNISSFVGCINASNPIKDKLLTFSNCCITNCKNQNVINVQGFYLTDFNQTTFIYNYPTVKHLYCQDILHLQISSCEFVEQKQINTSNYGTANMIDLYGTTNSYNISTSLIHPQMTQNGLYIDNALTSNQGLVSSNVFVNTGLTTGKVIDYNITNHAELQISSNAGVPNEKAVLNGESNNNTTYTATSSGVFNVVDFGVNFTILLSNRFTPTGNPYEFKYTASQTIYILVNANIGADHNTGGNDNIVFGLSKNGVVVSTTSTSINSGTVKNFGYSTTLQLNTNDTLVFKVKNDTAGTNTQGFRAVSFNGTLIEV